MIFPDGPQQQPPGMTANMRTKPDHGEERYVGKELLEGKVAHAEKQQGLAAQRVPVENDDLPGSSERIWSMRKLTGAAFISLDGVIQAPGGPTEDPTGGFNQGGWV
jgi:hypothetical protein